MTNTAIEVKRFDAALRAIVRWLRNLVDAADERVHAWEVLLRAPVEEIDVIGGVNIAPGRSDADKRGNSLAHVRTDRKVDPSCQFNPKPKRRRHTTAAAFDLRFTK